VAQAADDRVSRLDVLPIFLSAGAHVERDIPELIRLAQSKYPEVNIRLLPAVGTDARVGALLQTLALEAFGEKTVMVSR
jgi:sirohydrochlorin cobaltochelatase